MNSEFFRWNGAQYKGAMRDHRQNKRDEAAERAKHTLHENTKSHRLGREDAEADCASCAPDSDQLRKRKKTRK